MNKINVTQTPHSSKKAKMRRKRKRGCKDYGSLRRLRNLTTSSAKSKMTRTSATVLTVTRTPLCLNSGVAMLSRIIRTNKPPFHRNVERGPFSQASGGTATGVADSSLFPVSGGVSTTVGFTALGLGFCFLVAGFSKRRVCTRAFA